MAFLDENGLARFKGKIQDEIDQKKDLQSSVASPSADGHTSAFIDTVSQNAQGVISATKKNVYGSDINISDSNNQKVGSAVEAIQNWKPSGNGTSGQVLRSKGDGTTEWAAAASQSEINTAVNAYMGSHMSPNQTIALDNSLTSTTSAAQAAAAGNQVLVSDSQPSASTNKLWIKQTPESEVSIPTMDEFDDLKSALNHLFDTLSDVVREVSINEVITDNKYIYYHMYFKKDNVYRITVNLVSVDLKNAGIRLYASPVGQYAQGEEIGRYAYSQTGDVIEAFYVPNNNYSDLCILVAGNSGTQKIDIRVEHLAYEAVNGIDDAEEMFTYYSHTRNLFDIAQATASKYVDNTTGELVDSGDYTASGFIEVEPSENYVISNTTTTSSSGMRFACYDDNGDFIENSGGQGTNSITTPATAKYVRFSFLSNRNNVMLEKGNTATGYIPFGVQFSGVMVSIGSVLFDTITGKNVVSNKGTFGTGTGIVRGSDFSPAIANYTSSDGATFANGKWSIGAGQSIQTTVSVTDGKTYFIQWELDSDSIVYSAHEPDLFTVSLGDQSIGVFYATDSTNRASLVASETGNVVLKLQMAETASGAITRVRITEFTQLCAEAMDINGTIVRAYNDNVAVGGGQKKSASNGNTAFGKGAQTEMNAGQNNAAFGYQAQRDTTAGSYNTACGNRAQMRLTTGMYNVGVGQLAQFYLTTGCWNNAMGNESQRDLTTGCDNVSIGRRSHNSLTTGNGNTAVGAQSGYINGDDDGTYNRTTTGNYQTTIGFNATQKSDNMQQFDFVTAIGAFARAGKNATAIGAKTKAKGNGSVAIGMDSDGNGAQANGNNQIAIGTASHSIILAGHKINFNQDGSVTWENI